jgi:hypothetical protein
MPEADPDVTQLLLDLGEGDPAAMDRLLPLVYDELHRLARRQRLGERADHTLNTTALVHEAYHYRTSVTRCVCTKSPARIRTR